MEIFKKLGKKNKLIKKTLRIMKTLRTASIGSNFTDFCQERSVNSQELFLCPSFGKFWGFFPLLVLSFCESTKLLASIVTFACS